MYLLQSPRKPLCYVRFVTLVVVVPCSLLPKRKYEFAADATESEVLDLDLYWQEIRCARCKRANHSFG